MFVDGSFYAKEELSCWGFLVVAQTPSLYAAQVGFAGSFFSEQHVADCHAVVFDNIFTESMAFCTLYFGFLHNQSVHCAFTVIVLLPRKRRRVWHVHFKDWREWSKSSGASFAVTNPKEVRLPLSL